MILSCRTLPILMLSVVCHAASAQSFGTLFTTPPERDHLDALRERFMAEQALDSFDIDQQIELPPAQENTAPAEILFQLSGIMTRSDGSRVIWLNGDALTARELPAGFRLREDGRALLIAYQDNTYTLFPGQTIDLQDGSLQEVYERQVGHEESSDEDNTIPGADNRATRPLADFLPPLMDTLQQTQPATTDRERSP